MTGMAETSYLKDLVGEALAQGCAVTVAQAPTDPVEFLGHWLLRFVESSSIERQFRAERQLKEQAAAEAAALAKTAAEAEAEQASTRQKAVAAIADMEADPLQVWSAAVNAVVAHTAAAAAYVANIVEPEEPDFQWPELEEGEEEPPETDDEGGDAPAADAQGEGEGEGEAAPAEEEAAEPEAEEGGEQKPTLKQKPDYSKCLFQYAAAAPNHQAFLVEDHLELRRPPPPTEEEAEDEAYKPAPTPPTFQVLDREQPSLYLHNAAYHDNVTFLAGFPRIGAYFAAASSDASGRYQSLLCADTLMPNGTGEMLGQEDRDFVWDVARAVGKALARATEARQSAVPDAHTMEEELLKAVQDIYQPAQAAAEGEVGEAAAAPPADGAEPDAADAPEEGGDAEAEVDDITRLTKEIAALAASIDAAQEGVNTTQAQLDIEQQVLAVVVEKLKELSAAALQEMNSYRRSPPATFHIAKAVMWLLGRKREEFDTWKKLLAAWNCAGLLEELTGYDATQERDLARWKEIRACYKAVPKKDPLFEELPTTGYGVFLLMFVKQVRKVARKAAKLRAFQATVQVQTETKSQKDEELDAAQKAKEAAEAEAAAAAEAEAAAAAAAAEQDGEGGAGEGEAAADAE